MASSLRSRLWLSYAVLIFVALTVVAVGLVIALQRNPVLYRQTITRISLAGVAISYRLEQFPRITAARLEPLLTNEANTRSLRLLILNADGSVLTDVGPGSGTSLPKAPLPLTPTEQDPNFARSFRDPTGKVWLYTLYSLPEQRSLVVATPAPVVRLREIFRNEVLGPFLQAALVALLLAVGLSLLVGQWIAHPLKRMAASARRMEIGNYQPITLEGPREVQQLGEALNEMANKVQSSQQSQRDFVANVSHELKTPLTSIQGFSQAILDGAVATPEALKQTAQVIYAESGRMYRLVIDLLSLARLEAGTADLQRTSLDLTLLLRSVVEKMKIQAEQKKIDLQADLTPGIQIIGDGDRLAQVFTNLVDNALKYTPEKGQVTVQARMQNGSAVVHIIDSGIGIAPEDQSRIFERFYQVDKSRKGGAGRGIGLGLAIAAQIVAAHGGRVGVFSQPGQGSTFTVSLPVTQSDQQSQIPHRRGL